MKTLRLIVAVAVALAIAMPGIAFGAADDRATPEWRAAGIIVKPKPGRDVAALSLPDAARATAPIGKSGLYRVAAGRDHARTLAALRANPAVEWAEPDYIRELLVEYTSWPNDPDFRDATALSQSGMFLQHARSWYLRGPGSVSADAVWPYLAPAPAQPYGARAAASAFTVGVIDTGFYMDHPDKGPNITAGRDLLDTYTYATDVVTTDDDVTPASPDAPNNTVAKAAHGTCVAGEVAAGIDNATGVAGSGYDALVRIYKVQGVCVDGIPEIGIDPGEVVILDSAVIDAIYQATDDGCKVITMSLGGPELSEGLQEAVDYAHANGVLVVAASGNAADDAVQYPAACDHAIGVGSYRVDSNTVTDPVPQRSSFTNYGVGLDLLAPGEGIWGFTKPDYDADGGGSVSRPGYTFWSGTSMATPLVAGGAAVLWRMVPTLSNDGLADVLFASARDMGPAGYDTGNGWGAYNMAAAREALVSAYPELPAPTLVESPAPVVSTTTATFSWQRVSGEDVTYRAALDGSGHDLADTTISFTGLSDGPHTVTITAMSPLNWWDPVRSSVTVSFAVDTTFVEPPPLTVTPVEGDAEIGTDRIGTAIAVSQLAFPEGGSPYVLIATAYNWPDALGGSALAGALDAPILLTRPDELPDAVIAEITRLGATHVIVLGGTGAVSAGVFDALDDLSSVPAERIAGDTRYETARQAAQRAIDELDAEWDGTVLVATGEAFPDALGGSPLSAARGWPVYLVSPLASQQPGLVSALQADGVDSALVLGGTAAVPPAVETLLGDALGTGSVTRLGGADRYATAATIARYGVEHAGLMWDGLAITTGENFPDALAGGVLQGRSDSVMLLTAAAWLPDVSAAELRAHADAIHEVRFLGGTGAISPVVRTSVTSILGE